MNERIRELRDQAWKLVSDEEQAAGNLYDAREQWERCDQKFAELIVRECSAVANHFSDGHELDQFGRKMYHYTVDIGQVINEYFGVEE